MNPRKLTLDQLIECRNKILANAQSLLEDANCLMKAQRYPRAFTLSHLASEEIAKLAILADPILRTLYEEPIQWDSFWKNWKKYCKHEAKLVANAISDYWMLPIHETYGKCPTEYTDRVQIRNGNKNMSLYVSFAEGKFIGPVDVITKEMAQTEYAEAIKRLEYSVREELNTEVLISKFRKDPSAFQRSKKRKGIV